jgi:hypothetical protein
MPKSARDATQESFIEEIFPERPVGEPVASPPAPPSSDEAPNEAPKGRQDEGGRSQAPTGAGQQLSLPLEGSRGAESRPAAPQKGVRRGVRGFVPVTHDPDVARSYSDNASMDQAIAQGLAQVLAAMPPEELAALRAKVARAAGKERRGGARKLSD